MNASPIESSKRRPTISDVAQLSGVTKATVSKALDSSSRYVLSDEVRRRVSEAAAQLGYQPGGRGRGGVAEQVRTVALYYARSSPLLNDVYERLISSVARTLVERKCRFIHVPLAGENDSWKNLLEDPQIAGGLVIDPLDRALEQMLRASVGRFVILNAVSNLNVSQVLPDLYQGAAVLTRHLLELGHRRIALCGAGGRSRNFEAREDGYRQAMQSAGCDTGISICKNPVQFIEDRTKRKTEPTAVIGDTIATTIELLHACWSKGIQVPRDLSVAALEDAYPAEKLSPPVTSMRSPAEQLGSEAANLLVDQIEGEQSILPRKVLLSEVLVVRGSTAAPPAE